MKTTIKQGLKSSILSLSLLALLTGCTKEIVKEREVEKLVEGAKNEVEIKANMDAEQLAQAGEQLVSPYTFMLAQKVFDLALAKDPKNYRAQFYTALLKPWMLQKGIWTRMTPFTKYHGTHANHLDVMKNFPNTPLRDFVLDGKEDIKNVEDLQNHLVAVRDAWMDLRQFYLKNQNTEITLNMNPHQFQAEIQEQANENCWVKGQEPQQSIESLTVTRGDVAQVPRAIGSGEPVVIECNFKNIAQKKINAADMIALRQIAAGIALSFSSMTEYSVKDLDPLIIESNKRKLSDEEIQKYVETKAKEAGFLRADSKLTKLVDLGSDYTAAYKWALESQAQLCPKGQGQGTVVQRPGYLLRYGFCAADEARHREMLADAEALLKGPVTRKIHNNRTGQKDDVRVDMVSLAKNPIKDLRSVMAKSFNSCGKASALKDSSMGGVFVDNNAEDYVLEGCGQ